MLNPQLMKLVRRPSISGITETMWDALLSLPVEMHDDGTRTCYARTRDIISALDIAGKPLDADAWRQYATESRRELLPLPRHFCEPAYHR